MVGSAPATARSTMPPGESAVDRRPRISICLPTNSVRYPNPDWLNQGSPSDRGASTRIDHQALRGTMRDWQFAKRAVIYLSMLDMGRRIAAILLTLALTLGPGTGRMFASPDQGKAAVVMSSDMHSSGKCGDCEGSKAGMPAATCSISCSGIVAVLPGTVAADRSPETVQGSIAVSHRVGRTIPPDPYPPRPTILS